MKRTWFYGSALVASLLGFNSSLAQYSGAPNSFGPSSYPVQGQPQFNSAFQGVPQVPASYQQFAPSYAYGAPAVSQMNEYGQSQSPFQLASAQEQMGAYGLPGQHAVPPPVPAYETPTVAPYGNHDHGNMTAPQAGCQSCGPMDYAQQQLTTYPNYSQSLAPNCTSCGPAPVSGYASPYAFGGGQAAGFRGGPATGFGGGYLGGQGGRVGGLPAGASPWFAGGGVLLFNRVDDQKIPLSFSANDYSADVLTTRDARQGVAPGFEVMLGRYFNCGRNAIQASYWGIFPDTEQATRARTVGGDYLSRIPFTYMTMPGTPMVPGTPYAVSDWYANAFTHQLTRSSEYHNVEVNLLGFGIGGAARNFNLPVNGSMFAGNRGGNACGSCGGAGCGACGPSRFATGPCCLTPPACGSRLNMSWLAGFRYFHFSDNLLYAASLDDSVIDRSPDDLYYQVDTTNDLFGGQLGSRLDYCLGQRVNLYGSAKVGLYNNRSTLYTVMGTDVEDAYLDDTRSPANPSNGQDYRFTFTQNDVAFLSELGSGLGFRLSPKWTATVGYRAVIASGVATSPDNVRETFANYEDIGHFDNRGTLILHGLNIGALYNF